MHYIFLPINKHFDSGFGATADSFRDAASKLLSSSEETDKLYNIKLPICYLLRHSIELYLKSIITVFHKTFKIITSQKKYSDKPEILVKGNWRPLTKIHNIEFLYQYVLKLFITYKEPLEKHTRTIWEVPDDLLEMIKKINKVDERSTFFRYPILTSPELDEMKSSMKSIATEAVIKQSHTDKRSSKIFVMSDKDDEIIDTFIYDYDTLKDILDTLSKTTEFLSSLHLAVRMDLCDGF